MITVFEVSKPGVPVTRIHLPNSAWGISVVEKLREQEYRVSPTGQESYPDNRLEEELCRMHEILGGTDL